MHIKILKKKKSYMATLGTLGGFEGSFALTRVDSA